MHLFRHRHQHKLKLLPRRHHSLPLIPDMLQRRRNIYLLSTLGHAVKNHIYQTVSARPSRPVAAVHHDRARPASVRLVDFPGKANESLAFVKSSQVRVIPSELEKGLGGGGDSVVGPRQKVELGDGPRLPSFDVLQVETPDEVVVAPDVLAHEMDFVDVVDFAAFFGPVPVTHGVAVLG